MKQINFEADISDAKWVHPKQPPVFQAACPKCGETDQTTLDEDEYPNEERTLYFDCERCESDFQHTYKYEKVVYFISIPDEVEQVG